MGSMTLREKLELAGYRLRALSAHMPSEWQTKIALSWADDAIRASGMEARSGETAGLDPKPASPAPQGETPNLLKDHP